MKNIIILSLVILFIILVLIFVCMFKSTDRVRAVFNGNERFAPLDASYIYPKTNLKHNDSGVTTMSYNKYNVFSLKSDTDLGPIVTSTKGFDDKGNQNIMCQASNLYPKNVYTLVNQDAICAIAADKNGINDTASWDSSKLSTTGKVYLLPEIQLVGNKNTNLRSGNGKSCSQQYIDTYGATNGMSNILLDNSTGQYFKYVPVKPVCSNVIDSTYYSQVGITSADSIINGNYN